MMNRRAFLLASVATAALATRSSSLKAEETVVVTGERKAAPNTITVTALGGARNYPIRIARPFVQGTFVSPPQAVVDGVPLPTQADIKTRWPDGSIQHAVLSFILPRIPTIGVVTVSFQEQEHADNTPLTAEQLLAAAGDFDAIMQIYRGEESRAASAREMLANGDYTVWCAGPIATTVILADHSEKRKYDIGFDDLRSVRPIFHVTIWPALRKAHVRAIAEICCTEALSDVGYGVRLFAGKDMPKEVFRQDAVPHGAGTRWTKSFWVGGEPGTEPDIDHNLAYLTRTMAFPNFDTGIQIPANVIARRYQLWIKSPRYLYGAGGWAQFMPQTGGRSDIGHVTCPQATWLYSGDRRMFEMASGQADLAGAWPCHVREGDPNRWYDSAKTVRAIGRPVSVFARPRLRMFNEREKDVRDQLVIHGERLRFGPHNTPWGGWVFDGAHEPDPYSALYTLTGDYFALEQLQIWAAAGVTKYNPDYKGPFPSGAVLDQLRGNAWRMRTRVSAAYLSPDHTPEKAYFTEMVEHMLAFWEGRYGIQGTRRNDSPLWRFGNENSAYRHPLHILAESPAGDGEIRNYRGLATAPWQHYMWIFELGVAKEKGFDTGPLLSYGARMLTSQFAEPETYNFHNLARYWIPTRDPNKEFFKSWSETLLPGGQNLSVFDKDITDGFATYAYGASTMITQEPGGMEAHNWLKNNYYDARRGLYGRCPKWAYAVRGA